MSVIIENGLQDRFRLEASLLYFQAFWPKLSSIMGADRMEHVARLAAPRLRASRAVVARARDRLLGVAAFKQQGMGLVDLRLQDLKTIYGLWGGLWRGAALSLLDRGERDGELLMDGICVDVAARGTGVGTLLLDAIEQTAKAQGARTIRLDVIDTNPRARALYERRGFTAVRTRRLGPLAPVFGFAAATEMQKLVTGQNGDTP